MSTGLGKSSTWIGTGTYASFLAALVADKSTTDDDTAIAYLPSGPTNGVDGGTNIIVSVANLHAVGISTNPTPDGFDGTVSLNTSIMNLTRPPGDPAKYDLKAVAQHEIDEVLGSGSGLGLATIRVMDLYRYTLAGARTYTTSGDDAYFSIDGGTTKLARFNQGTGDKGDWWSSGPHTPQVQDAAGTPNATPNMVVELRMLEVIGYNFTVPEPGSLALLGIGGMLIAGRRARRAVK